MSLRVLIGVTHLLGAGHLTRAAALGRAAVARGHRAMLVTGGAPSSLVDTAGVEVVQLPPVRSPVGDFTTLLDAAGEPAGPDLLVRRREGLLQNFAAFRPDVVVTELFPFGRRILQAEFAALIEAAAAARPRPLLCCSIRDVLARPRKAASVERTHDVLRRSYDAVYVHGEAAVIPLEASWPVGPDLARRLAYTGYVGPEAVPAADPAPADAPPLVLVSGGSSAAALPLYRAALAAAAETPGLRWHVLVGNGVPEGDYRDLLRSRAGNAAVERARPDFRDLMRKSAIFVGQAGYNTVMDIFATQPRAVLAPFERNGEVEQRLRADALAARGLAALLPEERLDAGSLRRAVETALARPRPLFPPIRMDGARRTVELIERDRSQLGRHDRTGAAA